MFDLELFKWAVMLCCRHDADPIFLRGRPTPNSCHRTMWHRSALGSRRSLKARNRVAAKSLFLVALEVFGHPHDVRHAGRQSQEHEDDHEPGFGAEAAVDEPTEPKADPNADNQLEPHQPA